MGKFLDELTVRKVANSDDRWKVIGDFRYYSDVAGLITVPDGFLTDFASTPRAVWILFPKDGRWDGGAVIHDFCYGTHKFERSKCDAVFLEAMKTLGVGWITRHSMWLAVRMFGGLYY